MITQSVLDIDGLCGRREESEICSSLFFRADNRDDDRTEEHNRTRLIPSSSLAYVLRFDKPIRSGLVVGLWLLSYYTREPQSRTGLNTHHVKNGAYAVSGNYSTAPEWSVLTQNVSPTPI